MYGNSGKNDPSFTVVQGTDFSLQDAIKLKRYRDDDSSSDKESPSRFDHANVSGELSDSESEDSSDKVEYGNAKRQASAGPSGRQIRPKSPHPLEKIKVRPTEGASRAHESDDDSDDKGNNKKVAIPGEYDADVFKDLDVSAEIRELFQYITKYTPQHLNLDCKFKPFIPEFIPAVGDVDAFLKVQPPETSLTGDRFDPGKNKLGLSVLDEPASAQSDPALLHLQLRASSVNVTHAANMVVKRVENVERNTKVVDKWIKDISDLHKSKSSPVVKYSELMPDLDDLMQEWPEAMENLLKLNGFPSHRFNGSLSSYIDIACCLFDIPVHKNKIQSLHLLFCLYAVVKNSQLYHVSDGKQSATDMSEKIGDNDQLVLD